MNENIIKIDTTNRKINSFKYLLLYFLIYAFIGWLLETFYALFTLGHFTNRGFLYGPICPIYGFGAIILILLLQIYKSNSFKLFFYSAIIFSIFEYIVGFALDALFAAKWWDYTNDFMNLNGRISIFYSFAWGIIAILFINHIHPFIEKCTNRIFKKIPEIYHIILINTLLIILVVDTVFSCIKYFKLI